METIHQPHPQSSETTQPPEAIWDWQRREKASAVAERYRGTRHINRLNIPGEGVDCINFVMSVLAGAGIIPRVRLPYYDERLGSFRRRNVIQDIFEIHGFVEAHDPTEQPEFGDVVICQCGRQSNHVGIILDGWFWHVPAGGFCSPEEWTIWKYRSQALLRFTHTGLRNDPHKLRWADIKGLAD